RGPRPPPRVQARRRLAAVAQVRPRGAEPEARKGVHARALQALPGSVGTRSQRSLGGVMKAWVAVGAVLLSATTAVAQQDQDPVERSVQRLKDQLKLTDEQAAKVKDIVKKERDDIKAILTDEQKTTYDQGGAPRGNRPGGNNNQGNGNNATGFRGGAWLPATADLKT